MSKLPFIHSTEFQSHRAAMSFIKANYPPNTVTLKPKPSGDNVHWIIVEIDQEPKSRQRGPVDNSSMRVYTEPY